MEHFETVDQQKKQIRRFFDALRASERRNGNPLPIRYYGCSEHGGLFSRLHFHFLIYNLTHNYRDPTPYRQGLPRPRYDIKQWPHGFVDIAQFNIATLRYVVSYFMPDGTDDLLPVPYRTIRPAIGFYGIKRQAVLLAKTHTTLRAPPSCFHLHGTPWPIDRWTRDTFVQEFIKAGGQTRFQDTRTRKMLFLRESAEIAAATPAFLHTREEKKLAKLEKEIADGKTLKAQQKALIFATAASYAASRHQQTNSAHP